MYVSTWVCVCVHLCVCVIVDAARSRAFVRASRVLFGGHHGRQAGHSGCHCELPKAKGIP